MDAIFNMYKVKFVDLDALMAKHCSHIKAGTQVNLFINLDMIISKMTTTNIDDYLKVKNHEKIYEMVANIINLAAHYRLYFSKNKMYSKIYIYIPGEHGKYLNAEYLPDYREGYTHKYTIDPRYLFLRNTLETSLEIAKTILEYIKGVYLVASKEIEPSLTPRVILDEAGSGVNFILTNDRYDYQYVNNGFVVIRPKKTGNYLVTKDNVIQILKEEEKIVNKQTVNSTFLPFILSVLGDKTRNIPNIKKVGLSSTLKMINSAIEDGHISANSSSITAMERLIKSENLEKVRSNLLCIDLHSQYMRLGMRSKHMITNQLVDKFDNSSLKLINDRYFKLYPLRLVELTDANKLLRTKDKKDIFLT